MHQTYRKFRKEFVFCMKKFFALLIAAAMLCCIIAVPAAADGNVVISGANVNDVTPGDTVDFPIYIEGSDYEAHTLRMHVLYDANNLSVPEVIYNATTMLGSVPGGVPVVDSTTLTGDVAVALLGTTSGLTGSGTLLIVKFKVAETCTENQIVQIRVDELQNSPLGGSATPIPVTSVNGSINLKEDEPEPTETPVVPTEPPVEPTPAPTEAPVEPTEVPEMSANFSVTPKTVAADGSTITLQLMVSGYFVAHTMNVSVDYDTAALTLVNVAEGAAIAAAPADAVFTVDGETVPGSVRLGMLAPTTGFSSTGVLLEMTFKVADDFKANYPDGSPVTVNVTEFDNMPVGSINGVVIPTGSNGGVVIPPTGAISLIGLGVAAIASGAGVVLFRRKEN